MLIPTDFLLEQLLGFVSVTQAGAGQSIIFAAKFGLIMAPIAPTNDTALADLTIATFDGYAATPAPVAIVWSGVFEDVGGLVTIRGNDQHWQPTGNVTHNTIYGQYLVDTTNAFLLGVEIFNNPIDLVDLGVGFDSRIALSFDPAGKWGFGVVA